jgi:hypothetical protein
LGTGEPRLVPAPVPSLPLVTATARTGHLVVRHAWMGLPHAVESSETSIPWSYGPVRTTGTHVPRSQSDSDSDKN